jgi:hypothetical protein
MNKKEIQPIEVWSETGVVSANALCLKDFYHYHFDDGDGKVSYTIADFNSDIDYISGVIDIPSNIIQQWGADDTIIWDYVANSLSLTIINNQ